MAPSHVERIDLSPEWMLGLPETVKMAEISGYMDRAFQIVAAELKEAGAAPTGPPRAVYRDVTAETADVTAGFPVASPVSTVGETEVVALPAGEAIEATHEGPYDTLTQTYEQLMTYVAEQRLTPASVVWEEYLVGPDTEPDPQKWRTRIVFPLRSDDVRS